AGGYAMVGPSARTWSVDPTTGIPAGPVAEAEHRQVRDLIARELLDGAEPAWLRCADGGDEMVAAVVPAEEPDDSPNPDLEPGTGRAIVTDDLGETTARAGAPGGEWGLDQGDIDGIAAHHGLPSHLDAITGDGVVSCGNQHAYPAAYPDAEVAADADADVDA